MATASSSRWGPRVVPDSEETEYPVGFCPTDDGFTPITDVEWGPREDEPGYDPDQELASRPRKDRLDDPCGCQAGQGVACLDDSCIMYACREECSKNCEAGEYCGNKRLQRRQFKPTQVFDAGPKGRGLRTTESCRAGDFLGEYTGRAIRAQALGKLFRRYQLDRRLYIMSLGDGIYLDARQKGGLPRYINHSCEPNCKVERWKVRGVLRAAVVALKNLEAGEELTFDYQWVRRRGRAPTVCHCGTPSCRGTLEEAKSLEEKDLQRELEGHWERRQDADQTIVNRVVQVFVAEHQEYFLGEVTGYDHESKKHCILYRHDMNEVWEDLSKENWMILDETVDKEHFIIAKKASSRKSNGSLLAGTPRSSPPPTRHYLYVQTPIKEAFWSKHLIERCERNCSVQIHAEQMARPPLEPNMNDAEDAEKYKALAESEDGTVWKLSITGSGVQNAYTFLEKNVAVMEKKLTDAAARVAGVGTPNTAPTGEDAHEVIIPRQIAEAVKRRLPNLRAECRSVNISFTASESKNKQFSRLVLEGSLLSDIQTAKEHVWNTLVALCVEAEAPMTSLKIPRNLGFFGGALSKDQFNLLRGAPKGRLQQDVQEDLDASNFFRSFESTYRCTVWVQSEEDKGRVDSHNHLVGEATARSPRRVYFGCAPKEIPRLWSLIQSRAREVARGVKFLYLGPDRVYQALMMQNGGHFFEYVKRVTGASVTIDSMTGDHLRIDGMTQPNVVLPSNQEVMPEADRATLAEEIIRLQIELYRDNCIREHSWIFGRDWTLSALTVSPDSDDGKQPTLSLGKLDRKTAALGGIEIAEIVAALELPRSVAAHSAIILYRFVHAKEAFTTQVKLREAVLACIFLANKSQKAVKWKRLDSVLEAGYRTFYPGSSFDRNKEEVLVLEERVIAAEKEILESLLYDIFWPEIEWIAVAATGAGKMKESFMQSVFDFAFSGPVLSAGAELWLKYGVEYIFAVAAAFLKADLTNLLPALSLIPLKVSQAAEILVQSAKFGKSSGVSQQLHRLLKGGQDGLDSQIPRIKETCIEAMKKGDFKVSSVGMVGSSPAEQRYHLIGSSTRGRRTIRNIPVDMVKAWLFPHMDAIAAESGCIIFLRAGDLHGTESIVLDGPWKSSATAEYLFRLKVPKSDDLPPSTDASNELKERMRLQAKAYPGLLTAQCIQTRDGWDGTIQTDPTQTKQSAARLGGKSCATGRITESSLREAGLRWWIPAQHGPSPSGSISDMFLARVEESSPRQALGRLAHAFVGESTAFPMLTCSDKSNGHKSERLQAVSLQRWPPEKVESKEGLRSKTPKDRSMQIGFSPSALQEMQLLTQLHGVIPSPRGHPNFIVPVAIAHPGAAESNGEHQASDTSSGIGDVSLDDPMFSLFRQNAETQKAVEDEKSIRASPHLVFDAAPFVMQRFVSGKMRSAEELVVSPLVMSSWFHDLLAALVHCHTNHVVLRTILPDQIIVDHCGVAKLSGLYRCSLLAADERVKSANPLKAARTSKKKDDGDDCNRYAAPELLLGSPKHTKESDVWAMGCLLANLLLNKPFFVGKDRPSLLTSHYKIVGTPGKENFPEAQKFPHYSKPSKKYKRGVEKALSHMLKSGSVYDKAIDLIARMLHLDPKKRCTAAEALGHDFMVEYMEKASSQSFREQYVSDWFAIKNRMFQASTQSDAHVREEQAKKRRAMMISASKAASGDEDDLYDMDDLLDSEPKRAKTE